MIEAALFEIIYLLLFALIVETTVVFALIIFIVFFQFFLYLLQLYTYFLFGMVMN